MFLENPENHEICQIAARRSDKYTDTLQVYGATGRYVHAARCSHAATLRYVAADAIRERPCTSKIHILCCIWLYIAIYTHNMAIYGYVWLDIPYKMPS